MSGRAQLIQRSRQTKRRRKFIQLAGLLFLVLVAISLTIYALYRPGWRIEEVRIIGNETINSDELKQSVLKELSGSYFLLVPKDSQFFYSQNSLRQKVLAAFPRVASINFDFDGDVLDLNIIERESEFLWCLVEPDDVKKDCYFVDVAGVAFSVAPVFDEHVMFEVQNNISSSTVATSSIIGQVVLTQDKLKSIYSQKEAIHTALAQQKMFDRSIITGVRLEDNYYSFGVVSPKVSVDQWQLLTNVHLAGNDLAKSLIALFDSAAFEQNVIKNADELSYVDARLTRKIFFKVLDKHATSSP